MEKVIYIKPSIKSVLVPAQPFLVGSVEAGGDVDGLGGEE